MPNIPFLEQQTATPFTGNSAAATPEAYGGAVARAFIQAGAALKGAAEESERRQTNRELSEVAVRISEARKQWTLDLQDRLQNADPGDPEFSTRYAADLSKFLDESGADFSTEAARQAYVRAAAGLSADLVVKAGTAQTELAAKKVVLDHEERANNDKVTLVQDPSQYDAVLNQAIAAFYDPAGPYASLPDNLRKELVEETRQTYAASALTGVIRSDPASALEQIDSGLWDDDISADALVTLRGSAKTGLRAEEIERQRRQAEAERQLKEAQEATQNDFLIKLNSGELTAQEILDSNLDPTGVGSKVQYLNMLNASTKERAGLGPDTTNDLFSQIHTGAITDEGPINEAYTANRITREELNFLRGELAQARTPEGRDLQKTMGKFLDAVKPQIDSSNPLMGTIDQTGGEEMYRFTTYVRSRVEQIRKKPDGDPYTLFDPTHKDYLGNYIPYFQKSTTESMREATRLIQNARETSATANGRKPGESPADYLLRTKGK